MDINNIDRSKRFYKGFTRTSYRRGERESSTWSGLRVPLRRIWGSGASSGNGYGLGRELAGKLGRWFAGGAERSTRRAYLSSHRDRSRGNRRGRCCVGRGGRTGGHGRDFPLR